MLQGRHKLKKIIINSNNKTPWIKQFGLGGYVGNFKGQTETNIIVTLTYKWTIYTVYISEIGLQGFRQLPTNIKSFNGERVGKNTAHYTFLKLAAMIQLHTLKR